MWAIKNNWHWSTNWVCVFKSTAECVLNLLTRFSRSIWRSAMNFAEITSPHFTHLNPISSSAWLDIEVAKLRWMRITRWMNFKCFELSAFQGCLTRTKQFLGARNGKSRFFMICFAKVAAVWRCSLVLILSFDKMCPRTRFRSGRTILCFELQNLATALSICKFNLKFMRHHMAAMINIQKLSPQLWASWRVITLVWITIFPQLAKCSSHSIAFLIVQQ